MSANPPASCKGVSIRKALPEELAPLGRLMVAVYSSLEGFPTPREQPGYYEMLSNLDRLAAKPDVAILVAVEAQVLLGGVVFFGDMAQYGSGGTATEERNASGFRLLAVDPASRGKGIGKALVQDCLHRAKARGHHQVILHTTEAMKTAWKIYEAMGFHRSPDLDFRQDQLPVYGFRLIL